jgi:hypothetical protein
MCLKYPIWTNLLCLASRNFSHIPLSFLICLRLLTLFKIETTNQRKIFLSNAPLYLIYNRQHCKSRYRFLIFCALLWEILMVIRLLCRAKNENFLCAPYNNEMSKKSQHIEPWKFKKWQYFWLCLDTNKSRNWLFRRAKRYMQNPFNMNFCIPQIYLQNSYLDSRAEWIFCVDKIKL